MTDEAHDDVIMLVLRALQSVCKRTDLIIDLDTAIDAAVTITAALAEGGYID